ncbi:MAG: hypothetical protein WD403_06130 [Pirellulales bacterium]
MELDYVGLVSRWLHMLAAITAVGGTIFMRLALMPSVATLPAEQRKTLHEAVRGRWSKFVMAAILFLLLSGLYNFITKLRSPGIHPDYTGLYHGLFGVKFLLALAIFFIASALVGRSPALDRFRQNARFWMTANLVMAVIVVCISGVLRAVPPKSPLSEPALPSAAVPLKDAKSTAAAVPLGAGHG